MQVSFHDGLHERVTGPLVLGVAESGALNDGPVGLAPTVELLLRRVLKASRRPGQHGAISRLALPANAPADEAWLLGLGPAGELDRHGWQRLGGALAAALGGAGHDRATLALTAPEASALGGGEGIAQLAFGAGLRGYRDTRWLTRECDDDPVGLAALDVVAGGDAVAAWQRLEPILSGVVLARDLFAEPANTLYPASFVERTAALTEFGIGVEVLEPAELADLGMNAILAVGRGSARPPRVLVLTWNGAPDPSAAPLCLVGKGITFDSGGISIKPAKGMEEMKGDMAGGAAIAGAMRALAGRRAPVNAVGVIGLAENMPSGSAYRPGDVVSSMAGLTIEVINTDAEGRLVLLDLLWYAAKRFKPAAIVDLATLTYDIMAGLGLVFIGCYADDDALAGRLADAAAISGEKLWRMPLDAEYEENLGSDIADLRQTAEDSEFGDAAHAAQLLSRFADGVPWAHLDIAGKEMAYDDKPLCPKGATGVGVRLLDALADLYAKS